MVIRGFATTVRPERQTVENQHLELFARLVENKKTIIHHRACSTVCLGSASLPLSCLFDIWMPFRCLGSEQECLLEDSKDPPKTEPAANMSCGPSTPEAYLTPQSASKPH